MLTDTKLRNLKPRDKLYKVNDREGLYVGSPQKTESMVTPVFATPILTTSWLA
jgi:hypothetical protein